MYLAVLCVAVAKAEKAWGGHRSAVPLVVPHPRLHRAPASWVNGVFARCVRLRESHDGRDPHAAGNLYGLQGPHATASDGDYGWAGQFSRATQDWLAYQLYLRYGVQPWRPYDGC